MLVTPQASESIPLRQNCCPHSKYKWLLAVTIVGLTVVAGCGPQELSPHPPLSIGDFLETGDRDKFRRALRPIAFEFPRDHGVHPEFKNEWWYITGNLTDTSGGRFGFQFTLFRNAISAESIASDSNWATNQIYLAHVAVTDGGQDRFYSDERFSRGAMGLAGVRHDPFKAWLEDWSLVAESPGTCDACFDVRLYAVADEFSLDLNLSNTKPYVLHGDSGLSKKSKTPGNASYYYSYTRLRTNGKIKINDQSYAVQGESWLDHEWSTSSLDKDQVGWDWLSIQLTDHSEIMLFQLRHREDPNKNFVYGTYVDDNGKSNQLSDFTIEADDFWLSPSSGVTYPSGWRVAIPGHTIKLTLTPITRAQEINASFRYWEGAVDVKGFKSNQELDGHGYVELTGYD